MEYGVYLKGVKSALLLQSKAKREGVAFSKYENFDFMFKKELAIQEGIRKDHKILYKVVNNISSMDFRIACLFARSFSRAVHMLDKGYSPSNVLKEFKSIYKYAKSKYIYEDKLKIKFEDTNSNLQIVIEGRDFTESYSINNPIDTVSSLLNFTSYLCYYDEENADVRDFLKTYLLSELSKVQEGVETIPYVKNNGSISFTNYLGNRGSNVVQLSEYLN